MNYQAKLNTPLGMLGVRCDNDALTHIDFLAADATAQAALTPFSAEVCRQLQAYFIDPDARFTLAVKSQPTPHQARVWQAISTIPRGHTRSYGELASMLNSSAQAVGQACGANPVPIVVPCHRVVARLGMGGFLKRAARSPVKSWLLNHEQC